MARSTVSLGTDAFFAFSIAIRKRGFMSGSAPARAATMISLDSLVKIRPLAAAVDSLILVFHCAPMPASSRFVRLPHPLQIIHTLIYREKHNVATLRALNGEARDRNQQGEQRHVCSLIRARTGTRRSRCIRRQAPAERSEERRVGKECRSRWS